MRIVLVLILAIPAVIAARGEYYPNTKLIGLAGFAKKGGTTGGWKGPVVTVKNLADLKRYLTDTAPCTLIITANIFSPKKEVILLGANKSIIGSFKANVINNVYLQTSIRSSNIIFQNLVFLHNIKNLGNADTQIILDHGKRYWIDHCTFDGQKVEHNDLGKLLKVSSVDYVTVSHCKFLNHYYGLILGYPSDDPSGVNRNNNLPRMSIMYNHFDNINSRAPGLMRYGMFHVYNNYITRCHLGFTISFQSKIYSEHNFFPRPKENFVVLDNKGNGYFKDVGSKSMTRKETLNVKSPKWLPSADYNYKLKTPEFSRDFSTRSSGAQKQKLDFATL